MQPLIFFIFAAFVVVMIVLGAMQSARRRKQLAAWADENGWWFSEERDPYYDERYTAFDCLRQGSNRYGYNIIRGERHGRGFDAFDYHYETYSTDKKGRRQTHHHHFSAVILETQLPMKPLFIRSEGFFDKVTEFFGYDDIDFESAEFSRSFYVKSPDKKWAFDVIHQATMEFMLASPRYTLQFVGPYVIVFTGRRFDIEQFTGAMDLAGGILDRLPEYLIRELKGTAV